MGLGGAFEIEGLENPTVVGRGAFSTVYKAHQPRFSRSVALKVLDVDLRDERTRRRFDNECRRLGQLTGHPNIVTVLDSGVLPTRQPYLVMEFMEGGSLADRVAEERELSIADALRNSVRIAGALATAHHAGILHRDVKPANILRSRFGEPALADFGIAAVSDEYARASFSNYHTPAHAAPEVLEGEVAGTAADRRLRRPKLARCSDHGTQPASAAATRAVCRARGRKRIGETKGLNAPASRHWR